MLEFKQSFSAARKCFDYGPNEKPRENTKSCLKKWFVASLRLTDGCGGVGDTRAPFSGYPAFKSPLGDRVF